MRLPFLLATLMLLAGPVCAEPGPGLSAGPVEWTIEPADRDDRIDFQLTRRTANSRWTIGRTIAASSLQGLSRAQLAGDGGPVRFAVVRDAGTLHCEGVIRRRRGTGECGFVPDPRFAAALRARGIGASTADEQFSMTVNEVGLAFVDELRRQRYATPSTAELVEAGDHGVTFDYLRGMGGHGYRVGSLAALIRMRDHGVMPDYIASLAAYGITDVPAEQVVRLRDHGVTAEYVGQMRQLGYGALPVETLIQLRDHGVGTDYVRDLVRNGAGALPPAELMTLRDHGVTAEFVGALRAQGYRRFGTSEIIQLRDHGVTADYLRDLRDLGYSGLSAAEIVHLRTHGVTGDFIRQANGSGARRSVADLVRLRTGG